MEGLYKRYVKCGFGIAKQGITFTTILFAHQVRGFLFGVITGHIDNESLDGTYLAVSLMNLLGHLPILGLTSAIDVLGGQAMGSKQSLKSTFFLCMMCALPTISTFLLFKPILIHVHHEEHTVKYAGYLLRLSIAIVPINVISLCLVKYLYVLGSIRAVVYSVIVTIGFSLAVFSLAAFSLNANIISLQLAYVTTEALLPVLLFTYVVISKVVRETWPGFTSDNLLNWRQIAVAGLPSCGLILLEWGTYEVLEVIGSTGGPEIDKAHSIGFSVVSLAYMVHFGVGVATTTQLSAAIDSGNVRQSKMIIKSSLILCIIQSLLLSCIALVFRQLFTLLDSGDALTSITKWAIPVILLDSLQVTCNSILRAYQQYVVPTIVTTVGFLLAIVLGYYMQHRYRLVVSGIWIGLLIGLTLITLVLLLLTFNRRFDSNINITIYNASIDRVELVQSDIEPESGESDLSSSHDNEEHEETVAYPEENQDLRLPDVTVHKDSIGKALTLKGSLLLFFIVGLIVSLVLNLNSPTFAV